MTNIRTKIYKKYRHGIYPKIKGIRGTTQLARFLHKYALEQIEFVDENTGSIFEEEWDNLIILDACRHDLFEEVNGETPSRISKGSSTKDFIRENFSSGDYSDIVYITANPHLHKPMFKELTGRDPDDIFHSIFRVYEDKWDEEEGTVLPESVVKDALTADKLFPDKRKIIHFMQPHNPFIGYEIDSRNSFGVLEEKEKDDVWTLAEKNSLTKKEVWKAYKDNLSEVMGSVKTLSNKLSGKTVVTSDHGNLVGEKGLYGHPDGSDAKPLKIVPWEEF